MDSESTQPYCCPSLIKPDYSIPENSLSSALYSQRFYNDRILTEIIELAHKNRALAVRISQIRKETPSFLSNWWESGVDAAEIPALLSKVDGVLLQQIEAMAAAISEAKGRNQTQVLQFQNELEDNESLLTARKDLQGVLENLKQKNSAREEELNSILSQRKNFYNAINQLQEILRLLRLEKSIYDDQNQKIKASFPNQPEGEGQKKYFQHLKSFISYLKTRRQQVQAATAQTSSQLSKTNAQIEEYEQQSRLNQARKENIVSQHLELKKLNEELAVREQSRREAEQRRTELERNYCEQEMEKVASEYQQLQIKFDNLVGRALDLAKVSISKAKLKPLERSIIKDSSI